MKQEVIFLKDKKVGKTLNYIEHFLILASTIAGCISIFAFGYLLDFPIGIISSAIGLKFNAVTARVGKYKSIIKKIK